MTISSSMHSHRKQNQVPILNTPLFSSCWWPSWTFLKKKKEAKVIFEVEKQTATKETVTTSETITTIGSPLPFQNDDIQLIQGNIEKDCKQRTEEHALPPRTNHTIKFQKLSKEQFLSRRKGTVRYHRKLKDVTTDLPVMAKNQDRLPIEDTRDESKSEMHIFHLNPKRLLSPPALMCAPSSTRINSNNNSAQSIVEQWMNKTLGWDSEPQTPIMVPIPTTHPPPLQRTEPTDAIILPPDAINVHTNQLVSLSSPLKDVIRCSMNATTEQTIISAFLRLLFVPLHVRSLQQKLSTVFVQFIENELTLEFHAKLTRFYDQQQPPPPSPVTTHHNHTALLAYLRVVQLIGFLRTDTLHQEMEELRDSLLTFITENVRGENSNVLEGTITKVSLDASNETMIIVSS